MASSLRTRVESWIRDQTARLTAAPLPSLPRWPPWKGRVDRRAQERAIREEYERQRHQLDDLCRALKAESVADLQEILCSMVLSECVYKRPASDMIRYVNKFKSDFGEQIVSLQRVQPSLDHVPHRYLLAEAGDTIYASFIGTKQYQDVIADANILQGAIFHEDDAEEFDATHMETDLADAEKKFVEIIGKTLEPKQRQTKNKSRPAAHRGFLARAKGIPALELYKLAQKKNQKLVLCGHSLGGAVAVLSTLAILRILASSPLSKDNEKVQVKCITFSQPPVGNAALRDYVHQKGWQRYFKTYCIPEDLVPRLLSPAYFHHYNSQGMQPSSSNSISKEGSDSGKSIQSKHSKRSDGKQLVLGLGPVQTSFWRLSKLVPLDSVRKHISTIKNIKIIGRTSVVASALESTIDEATAEPQSLEIQEGSDGISLTPLVDNDARKVEADGSKIDGKNSTIKNIKIIGRTSVVASALESTIDEATAEPQSLEIQEGSDGISLTPLVDNDARKVEADGSKIDGKNSGVKEPRRWQKVPSLPSYIPFGQLYLLGSSSVESLSDMEYSKLTSVNSVITELKELLQSHSMKSYRSRFQKIYDMCMSINMSSFLGMEQLTHFPYLQQLIGLTTAGTVELGHIVEPPVIRTATSILPLGWSGIPGDKNSEPLKVDILGHGLHLCNLVQAQVNGNWCSTALESIPPVPPLSENHKMQPELQKMRIIIGPPLKRPPKYPVAAESMNPVCHSADAGCPGAASECKIGHFCEERLSSDVLPDFFIYCTSDFVTVCKKVHMRTRRVRLLGLEGAGKTSLFRALFSQSRPKNSRNPDMVHPEVATEGIAGGLCYLDSEGVDLQKLHTELSHFKEELQKGTGDLSRKTDLVVLVHNLSHRVPLHHESSNSRAALSLFLNEIMAHKIPWILAITNKFSVSAHQQRMLISSIAEAYRASPNMTEVVNSCPFVVTTSSSGLQSVRTVNEDLTKKEAAQKVVFAPINLARISFQKKDVVMPMEGVSAFRRLVHSVLMSQEEMAFQELANERLSLELAKEKETSATAKQNFQGNGNSITAAAVGASLGAGLGFVMAVVMGAASALRKP